MAPRYPRCKRVSPLFVLWMLALTASFHVGNKTLLGVFYQQVHGDGICRPIVASEHESRSSVLPYLSPEIVEALFERAQHNPQVSKKARPPKAVAKAAAKRPKASFSYRFQKVTRLIMIRGGQTNE